jgi:hypothetical protein
LREMRSQNTIMVASCVGDKTLEERARRVHARARALGPLRHVNISDERRARRGSGGQAEAPHALHIHTPQACRPRCQRDATVEEAAAKNSPERSDRKGVLTPSVPLPGRINSPLARLHRAMPCGHPGSGGDRARFAARCEPVGGRVGEGSADERWQER